MDCPRCQVELQRATYEEVRVMQCPECRGYFVAGKHLRLIKSSREQSAEALDAERTREQAEDTQQRIRCPKCRVERMRKQRIRVSDEETFQLDVCPECDRVWLDGGELARLQLHFEQSARALEMYAMQRRAESRTDEQRAAFDEQLQQLPAGESWMDSATTNLGLLAATVALAGIVFMSLLLLSNPQVAAVASVLLAALAGWVVVRRLDTGTSTRLGLLVLTAVVEFGFLVWLWWSW